MSPKKKQKPSFNVPEELHTAPQTGWVYRSESDSEPHPEANQASQPAEFREAVPEAAATPIPEPPPKTGSTKNNGTRATSKSDMDLFDLAALTISSGFEAIGNAMLLTTRIITAPFSMGMKMLGWK